MRDLSKLPALGATALALALTAAACGGGDSDITATADNSQAASAASDTADGGADADETADDSATAGDDAGAESEGAAESDDAATGAPSAPVWASAEEAEAAANENIGTLQSAEDVLDIQVLSVHDGAVSSLREAVTGDRPVLLWFYAPH